jgi:pyridoxamine 5'-phosphate oxidase-like protein
MLSPVWNEWRDGGFNIWSGGASEGKVRHLEQDPRASIVVAEQAMPYRGVDASGRATLSLGGFHDVVRRTAARYMSPEEADGLAAEYPDARPVIRLVPDRMRAWDFNDDEAAEGEP